MSAPVGWQLVATTKYWNIWATPTFYTQYQQYFTAQNMAYPDSFIDQFIKDTGYSIFPLVIGDSYDGQHMDLVLDPAYQGGASTGTGKPGSTFPQFSYGVSVSPDAIYNVDSGITSFWYYILVIHESMNVWTGALAKDWVWADGSTLWNGESPYPNMTDIVVTGEIGLTAVSQLQASRFTTDAGVQLFQNIQQTYGWPVYQKLFALTRANNITNWGIYAEPLRTAIICWFMSFAADTSLLAQFNVAIQAYSGQTIPATTFAQAQTMFPLSLPTQLKIAMIMTG